MSRAGSARAIVTGIGVLVLGSAGCGDNESTPSPPVVSGLPVPNDGGVPRPNGTPGNLTVIDWAGFHGAVSYTLDDSQPSQIEHYAELQAAGVPMTFYLASGWEDTSASYVATWAQAVRDGHEIGNHTLHHCRADLTGCSVPGPLATPLDEIDANTSYITKNTGQSAVWTMASPFGDTHWDEFAGQRFILHRDVFQGMVAPNDSTDPLHLPCYMAGATQDGGIDAQQSTFEGLIDAARSGDTWLIFLFHTIMPTTNNWYGAVDIGAVTGSMKHATKDGDVWVDTLLAVGAYWRAQKLLASVTPSTASGVMTWSWTLPDNFPPGKYLRVTVDGGTLTQRGNPLAWDEHGYYEVALDDGSLTLSR